MRVGRASRLELRGLVALKLERRRPEEPKPVAVQRAPVRRRVQLVQAQTRQ